MIKKTFATLMMITSLSISSMTFAADLEQNMKTLGKNYKAFNQSSNSTDAMQALNNMRIAALDAKKAKLVPQGGQVAQPSSAALFDQLVAEIDKTKGFVQAGQLDHAKMEGKKLGEIRDQGHKIYR
ncbi:cytochrome b562 [Acinetobacter sp. ANC 4648]|uniref:cytochrome b562 n=1 Tax=Acinetobacter sp. ANC 4648 TaxID=1977875 RepID=UPI000A35A974|nr:cytochrome b562 [Acinetobacter sp. ANC 4648]OTG84041.1 ATP-binding protein [Acinetobacter sp. ANC 4648]